MNPEETRQQWAERSGEYSPDYYAYYGPDETSDLLRARLDALVGADAAVLELGCSCGRHLAHLHEHGYENLHGVDINDEAFEVMADAYPDLFAEGTFHADAIENAVREFPDGRFDAVYSVETLQHLHPDNEWVFDELVRITDDLLVTVENEESENDGGEGGGGESDGGESGGGESDGSERVGSERAGNGSEESDRRRSAGGRRDESEGGESANGGRENGGEASYRRGVSYVNDEFPLYHRDWREVFTTRGFAEVEAESLDRDTLRAFRLSSDRLSNCRDPN